MESASNFAPFYVFSQDIQVPFSNGMSGTISAAMSAVQTPLTSTAVLWVMVTGILVMRGDVSARSGVTRIMRVSIVMGLLMSTTLYNEYVTSFFTSGLPSWLASTFLGVTGTQPSAHQFDAIWNDADALILSADQKLNFTNVIYSVELAILQDLIIVPIFLMFAIYETALIMMDVVVCLGPFVLVGYLFEATKGVADRWIGKLIGLSILMLLVDVVLNIIIKGDEAFYAVTNSTIGGASISDAITISIQFLSFLALGALISVFLPGTASFIGGGVTVSPMAMVQAVSGAARAANAMRNAGRGNNK